MQSCLGRHIPALSRRHASSSSSQVWLNRQSRDPYVKARAEEAFRSRSAFKLLELDERYHFLRKGRVVVDLGAAPGGWSEAAIRKMHASSAATDERLPVIIAVDLLPIVPIEGVITLQGEPPRSLITTAIKLTWLTQGDFLAPATHARVKSLLEGRPVDVVLSDMCENVSGTRDRDAEHTLQLCHAAFSFASKHLHRWEHDPKRGVLM